MVSCIELLLKNGAEADGYNGNKCPHLVTAAEYGCSKILKLLIQHGAHLEIRTNNGSTALHRSSWHGSTTCVEVMSPLYLTNHAALAKIRSI